MRLLEPFERALRTESLTPEEMAQMERDQQDREDREREEREKKEEARKRREETVRRKEEESRRKRERMRAMQEERRGKGGKFEKKKPKPADSIVAPQGGGHVRGAGPEDPAEKAAAKAARKEATRIKDAAEKATAEAARKEAARKALELKKAAEQRRRFEKERGKGGKFVPKYSKSAGSSVQSDVPDRDVEMTEAPPVVHPKEEGSDMAKLSLAREEYRQQGQTEDLWKQEQQRTAMEMGTDLVPRLGQQLEHRSEPDQGDQLTLQAQAEQNQLNQLKIEQLKAFEFRPSEDKPTFSPYFSPAPRLRVRSRTNSLAVPVPTPLPHPPVAVRVAKMEEDMDEEDVDTTIRVQSLDPALVTPFGYNKLKPANSKVLMRRASTASATSTPQPPVPPSPATSLPGRPIAGDKQQSTLFSFFRPTSTTSASSGSESPAAAASEDIEARNAEIESRRIHRERERVNRRDEDTNRRKSARAVTVVGRVNYCESSDEEIV